MISMALMTSELTLLTDVYCHVLCRAQCCLYTSLAVVEHMYFDCFVAVGYLLKKELFGLL